MSGKSARLRWVAAAAAVAAATLAACSSSSPASTAAAAAANVPSGSAGSGGLTTINVVNTLGQENLQIAKDEGFFKKYGLNVNISYLDNGADVLEALEGGSADIGYADLYAGINAVSNGFNVQLVANNNGNPPSIAVAVKPGGGISSVADLAGKKIGISPVPQFTVNIRGFLQANGVNPDSVQLVDIQAITALPQALQGGTVDAFLSTTWSAVYQNGFTTVGNGATSAWSNAQATTAGFWSTNSWATAHPQAEDEFDNALHAFDQWWKALSPSQASAIELKYYGVNFQTLSDGNATKLANLIASTSGFTETGPINVAATQQWYQLGLKYAADKIAKGVDLKAHIFPSALQPAPSS